MLPTKPRRASHPGPLTSRRTHPSFPQSSSTATACARITDPYGNHWAIATHIEDLTPDELANRLAALGEG